MTGLPTPEEAVLFEKRGKTAIITLNQPQKLNALTQEYYFRIASLLNEIAEMEDVVFTVVTGNGRFFSAGADVSISRESPEIDANPRLYWNRLFVAGNLHNTHAWYSHPKILIVALNGPAVGISAALSAHADFIYAAPHTYLLTPFTSLGLVAEGGSSKAFVERLGISKANEALLMSRRLGVDELLQVGYVNKVITAGGGDRNNGKGIDNKKFLDAVLAEVDDRLGDHLVHSSMLKMKTLIRKPGRALMDQAGVDEVWGGLDVFLKKIPQAEFAKIASGQKKHKL